MNSTVTYQWKSKGLLIIIALLFILVLNGLVGIGEMINRIIPCAQNPLNSFPCHLKYDMYFMLFLGFAFLIIGSVLIFKTVYSKSEEATKSK